MTPNITSNEPRQPSKSPGPQSQPSPRLSGPRGRPEIVDLEDDVPLSQEVLEEHARCPLIPSMVAKYKAEVDPGEGVRALELITLKVCKSALVNDFYVDDVLCFDRCCLCRP
jgi:hypothetical protein